MNDGIIEVYRPAGPWRAEGYCCPFEVGHLGKAYISVLGHADGKAKYAEKARNRAQHRALAEYLRNLPWADSALEASKKVIGAGGSCKRTYRG